MNTEQDTNEPKIQPKKEPEHNQMQPEEGQGHQAVDPSDNPMPEESTLDVPPSPEKLISKLKEELAAAEQKAQDNWDKALRAQAEMENLKRRTQKDLEDAHKFALDGFAKALLPVIDSLELGLQAATGDSDEVNKFREGSELTLKQFEAAFNKFNIETLNPKGESFNAEQHQAMVMQEAANVAPNTIVNVFQKGYMLNGRLLRPALVVVAKAPEKKPETKPINPPKDDNKA